MSSSERDKKRKVIDNALSAEEEETPKGPRKSGRATKRPRQADETDDDIPSDQPTKKKTGGKKSAQPPAKKAPMTRKAIVVRDSDESSDDEEGDDGLMEDDGEGAGGGDVDGKDDDGRADGMGEEGDIELSVSNNSQRQNTSADMPVTHQSDDEALPMPKKVKQHSESTRDLVLFFGPSVTARFKGPGKGKSVKVKNGYEEKGRWCNRCR